MEELVKSFNELQTGDVVLIENPITNKDVVGSVTPIIEGYKYPIRDTDGSNKRRNYRDKNGKLLSITAEEEGCSGDEMIKEADIWFEGGSMHVNELTDFSSYNIRKIDKDHPDYDDSLSKQMDMMDKLFKGISGGFEGGFGDII